MTGVMAVDFSRLDCHSYQPARLITYGAEFVRQSYTGEGGAAGLAYGRWL